SAKRYADGHELSPGVLHLAEALEDFDPIGRGYNRRVSDILKGVVRVVVRAIVERAADDCQNAAVGGLGAEAIVLQLLDVTAVGCVSGVLGLLSGPGQDGQGARKVEHVSLLRVRVGWFDGRDVQRRM